MCTRFSKGSLALRTILALHTMKMLASVAVAMAFLLASSQGQTSSSATKDAAGDWKLVEGAMGRPGQILPGGVFKFAMPRKDLHITLDGVAIPRLTRSDASPPPVINGYRQNSAVHSLR